MIKDLSLPGISKEIERIKRKICCLSTETDTGEIVLSGTTSGAITVEPQATTGTYNFNLPISAGSSGQPLLSGGGGSTPMTFGTLDTTAGGTNITSYAIGDILYASALNILSKLTIGSSSDILTVSGGIPAWTSTSSISGLWHGRNAQSGTTYNIQASDIGKVVALTNVATRTITLPLANTVSAGYPIWLKDEAGTAGTANITINRSGGDTIDGITSILININYQVTGFYSNGSTGWFII